MKLILILVACVASWEMGHAMGFKSGSDFALAEGLRGMNAIKEDCVSNLKLQNEENIKAINSLGEDAVKAIRKAARGE